MGAPVTASDPDQSDDVAFAITGGDDNGVFAIDAESGQISVRGVAAGLGGGAVEVGVGLGHGLLLVGCGVGLCPDVHAIPVPICGQYHGI